MRKKLVVLMLVGTMAFSMAACGSTEKAEPEVQNGSQEEIDSSTKESQTQSDPAEDVEKDLPDGDYEDMGNGTIYISTVGGTSENGNVPIIYISDEILLQIGLNASGFDGSKLSFIYIDGMLSSKDQLADSQISLDLQDGFLSVGTHKIEVVQYDNNEPTGNMITYKSASYEIKEK